MAQYSAVYQSSAHVGTAITTNASTQVKTGTGIFFGFSVNTAGSAWTATVYDGTDTSGKLLYTIDLNTVGPVVTPPTIFNTGLFVVTAGTTAGSVSPVNL